MGRRTKLQKAPSASTPGPDQADHLLQRTIAHLELLLGALESTLESGDATPALARESANVARAMTGVAAELRQREKHAQQVVDAMSPAERHALVAAYIRDLTPEDRAPLRALLAELDDDASVLGV